MSTKDGEIMPSRLRVLREIHKERERQDEKWGEQNHPDGTGGQMRERWAAVARAGCNDAAENGELTWRHILHEETCEAFAENDPGKIREELIQVAAVAVNWIEAIDRRRGSTNG